jgi:hypothetical protein
MKRMDVYSQNLKGGKMSKSLGVRVICLCVVMLVAFVGLSFSDEAREGKKEFAPEGCEVIFNSNSFQSGIESEKSLGSLVKTISPLGEDAVSYGFAAKSDEAKIFIIGALYSEGLAYLKSGDMGMAKARLESISKEFINLNVPSSLYNYTTKMQNWMNTEKYTADVLVDFYALFQPFFEDFARGLGEDELILSRAGSWFVDMSLSAAAGDRVMLKQTETIKYFAKEMKRMDAPKGVLDALDKIAKIAEKDEISDKDIEKVLESVKKIQTILG